MLVLSCIWLFATSWTVTHQSSLSTGFPRQEYWSGLPFPSPVDHVLSDLCTMTRPSWVALYDMDEYNVDEFVSSRSHWYWNLSSLKIKITFMKKQGHQEILNWTNVEYSKKYGNKAWLRFSFSFFKRCLWFKLGLPRWLSHKRIHLPM